MPEEKRRGRPKTTEPVTILARLDKQFAEEVKDYAELHRVPVSMLVRDGLHWVISGRPQTPPPVYSGGPSLTPHLGARTVSDQLRQLAAVLDQDVIHVIQESHDTPTSTEEPVEAVFTPETAQAFDPSLFFLGALCRKGHGYQGTVQSLRRRSNHDCVQCGIARKEAYKQRQA